MIDAGRTVAAISTPHGRGGVAMIRISGDETADVLRRVFVPAGRVKPDESPRTAVFGRIVLGGEVIDTGVATYYAAPRSFTGECMAELCCHGGVLVTRRVLEAVFAAGASPAGPGEFTRRAFLSGKLTLSEAEGIGLLLDADTDSAMRLASAGARGVLSERLGAIGDKISEVLSALFAVIDYPDEDIDEMGVNDICARLTAAAEECRALASTFQLGRAVTDGIPTVIIGAPNAGKSTLYNALAGEDRAIVTDVAGTTRDVLEDKIDIGGAVLRLWDTAGIRDSEDTVESIGIDRALDRLGDAELVLAVYDGASHIGDAERRIMDEISARAGDACTVAVISKADTGTVLDEGELALLREHHDDLCVVSAATGEGVDSLRELILSKYGAGEIDVSHDAVVWDASRKAELDLAASLLCDSAAALASGEPEDAVCTTVELALAALRRTDGRGVSEEVVSGIFSHFCVGK